MTMRKANKDDALSTSKRSGSTSMSFASLWAKIDASEAGKMDTESKVEDPTSDSEPAQDTARKSRFRYNVEISIHVYAMAYVADII
jgi:hypothetical protein